MNSELEEDIARRLHVALEKNDKRQKQELPAPTKQLHNKPLAITYVSLH